MHSVNYEFSPEFERKMLILVECSSYYFYYYYYCWLQHHGNFYHSIFIQWNISSLFATVNIL